jgi:hypothetical protein
MADHGVEQDVDQHEAPRRTTNERAADPRPIVVFRPHPRWWGIVVDLLEQQQLAS